uniref:Uncharacterized protein n=1 Tax=Candidatus Kentrum sp. DK TaxID=2126562 RepID=A0A450SJ26_9GAMM|nr:MAG: hypothetical protein BECKDK2373B_GA0170837_104213 [Candidatus Kentron sp. DK]
MALVFARHYRTPYSTCADECNEKTNTFTASPAWERNSRKLQLSNHARPSWKLGCEEKIPDMVIAGTARSYTTNVTW